MNKLLFFLPLLFVACQKQKTVKPETKDLVDAVYASGVVMPSGYYKVSSNFDGTLNSILVKEGEVVRPDQLLMVIDPEASDWKSNAAAAAYQQAQINASENSPVLNELQNSLRTASLKYKQDSLNLNRFSALWEAKAVSQLEYEKADLSAKSSFNEYKAALERYNKTKRQLQVDYKNAEAAYLSASKEGSEHRLKSSSTGKIFELYKKQGELVRKGEALALVGKKDTYVLEIWIDEEDLGLVKKGQEVLVSSDVYNDSLFIATVTEIYPSLNTQRQAIKVEAVFVSAVPLFPSNSNIEANIVIQRIANAVVVPKYCLIPGDSLQLKTSEGMINKKVTTGVDQGDYVQIISGVSEKDEIVVPVKRKK